MNSDGENNKINSDSSAQNTKKRALNEYSVKINCLERITFYPVTNVEDYRQPTHTFKPLYVHHFFGLKEEISGVSSDLFIKVYYLTDTLDVFINVEVDNELLRKRVISYFGKVPFPGGFHVTEATFLKALSNPNRLWNFKPLGNLEYILDSSHGAPENKLVEVYEYKLTNEHQAFSNRYIIDPTVEDYENVFQSSSSVANNGGANNVCESFVNYHRRVEWFLHFFIDACSNIEYDNYWTVKLIYVKCLSDSVYQLAGILSVYKFFALPQFRSRVSQFLILPPFQRKNLALNVLLNLYKSILHQSDISEITVEDPAKSFAQLRDVAGLILCVNGGCISKDNLFGEHPDLQLTPYITPQTEPEPPIREVSGLDSKEQLLDSKGQLPESEPQIEVQSKQEEPLEDIEDENEEELAKRKEKFELCNKIRLCTKESVSQVKNLYNIISLAKILPKDIQSVFNVPIPEEFSVPTEILTSSREWRSNKFFQHVVEGISEEAKLFHNSQQLVDLRLSVKGFLLARWSVLYEDLWVAWKMTFQSFCRCVLKVRAYFEKES